MLAIHELQADERFNYRNEAQFQAREKSKIPDATMEELAEANPLWFILQQVQDYLSRSN